jgi:hypothetical protein
MRKHTSHPHPSIASLALATALLAAPLAAHAQLDNLMKDLKASAQKMQAAQQTPAPAPAAAPAAPTPVAATSATPAATAAQPGNAYPAELQGRYAYSAGALAEACGNPALTIQKAERYNDVDAACQVTRVSSLNGKYEAEEKCGREGRTWTQKSTLELKGGNLTLAETRKGQAADTAVLRKCPAATASNPAAAPASAGTPSAAKTLTCTLNPGQAGVTTYRDANLQKTGAPIREIDGYVFKAEQKLKLNKREVLAGKLLRADGSVSEAKSYADAEEWACS